MRVCETSGGVEIKPGMTLYRFLEDQYVSCEVDTVAERSFRDTDGQVGIGFMWQSSASSARAYTLGED
jgi:hypothetical protein